MVLENIRGIEVSDGKRLIFRLPFYTPVSFLFYIDFSFKKNKKIKKIEAAVIFYICWYPPFLALFGQ